MNLNEPVETRGGESNTPRRVGHVLLNLLVWGITLSVGVLFWFLVIWGILALVHTIEGVL